MANRYYIAKKEEKGLFVYRGPFNTQEYADMLAGVLCTETGLEHVVLNGTYWGPKINYEGYDNITYTK